MSRVSCTNTIKFLRTDIYKLWLRQWLFPVPCSDRETLGPLCEGVLNGGNDSFSYELREETQLASDFHRTLYLFLCSPFSFIPLSLSIAFSFHFSLSLSLS